MGAIGDRRAIVAWALYDWACMPFSTLIVTFVFATYFARQVATDPVTGQALWSYAAGISGLVIAVTSPIIGAVADAGGRVKPWLFTSSAICAAATASLWFVEPASFFVAWALLLFIIANIGYASAVSLNSSMLCDLVPADEIGRWSGWSWGLGYTGGLLALVLMLVGFIERPMPWLALDRAHAEDVRIVGPFVAVWLAAFGWPRFIWTPDRPRSGLGTRASVFRGFASLKSTLRSASARPTMGWFLLANMLYSDGLTAIFAAGGIYAAGAFGMTLTEVTTFGIVLNIAAGIGSFTLAWLDDCIGSRTTILIALAGVVTASLAAVLAFDRAEFWFAGAAIGLFVGPVQASSRSLMARLAPLGRESEYFGLFALSGRATGFLGPALVGVVTSVSGSQRVGLASLLVFLVCGMVLLLFVPDSGPERALGSN